MMVLSDKGIKLTDQQAHPMAPTPKIARQKCIQGREVLNRVEPWESIKGTTASMPKKKRKKEIWIMSSPAPKKRIKTSLVTLTKVIITAQKAPWGYPLRINQLVDFGGGDSIGKGVISSSAEERADAGDIKKLTLMIKLFVAFLQGFREEVEEKRKHWVKERL